MHSSSIESVTGLYNLFHIFYNLNFSSSSTHTV